jgi:hypothetical protein
MPTAARVGLVGMLPPQAELVAILPGGGLLQAMGADRSEDEQPWVPVVPWRLMVHGCARPSQSDAGRGSRTTTAVGDDRLAA